MVRGGDLAGVDEMRLAWFARYASVNWISGIGSILFLFRSFSSSEYVGSYPIGCSATRDRKLSYRFLGGIQQRLPLFASLRLPFLLSVICFCFCLIYFCFAFQDSGGFETGLVCRAKMGKGNIGRRIFLAWESQLLVCQPRALGSTYWCADQGTWPIYSSGEQDLTSRLLIWKCSGVLVDAVFQWRLGTLQRQPSGSSTFTPNR